MIVKGNIRKVPAGGYDGEIPARACLELQQAAALLITPLFCFRRGMRNYGVAFLKPYFSKIFRA